MSTRNAITLLLILILILVWSWVRKWRSEAVNENESEALNMGNLKYNGTGKPATANFQADELNCKDGTAVPAMYYGNAQELLNRLQIIRDHIGVPIMINSGYRSPAHNSSIGGAKNSQHLYAKAADIVAVGYTAAKLHAEIEKLIKAGKLKNGGLGRYSSFVHFDIGPVRRWNG